MNTKLLFLLLIMSVSAFGQKVKDASQFFEDQKLIETGVYYYPEHWPEEQWERDFANMSKMGFEFTHFAEFAWQNVEPADGKFDFAWLDKAVGLAAKYNLKVIMCTPTPTPPAWLAAKHPELFLWDINYTPREHASRGNYSFSHDLFWQYTERYVTELAKRYGKDKRIWGWQLDNEPGGPEDYSPAAQEKFRDWLESKYQTIQSLNKQWGNAFWGVTYDDFSQIRIPNKSFLYGVGPHAILDYKRFISEQHAAFLNFQADIIRKYSNEDQWITTNFISTITGINPRDVNKLDFMAFTNYPVAGGKNSGELGFRLGTSNGITFASGFYRPIKGATGIMELQPGQVNWAYINPQPYPGAVRMWLWHVYGGGSSFACTYRYRQPRYGSELYHAGIVGTDGVTPSRGGLEYQQFMKEIADLRKKYSSKAQMPDDWKRKKTALLWKHDNYWDLENHRQTGQWNTFGHFNKYMYSALAAGAPVDIISEQQNFNDYALLIAPAYQLLDQTLVEKWKNYVEQGGNLILTCRTGQKDNIGQLWEGKWAAPINDLIGAEIKFFDVMLPDGNGKVTMDGKTYNWDNWGDVLLPKNSQTIASYDNQFYQGEAAVISRKLGKGTVTYVGVDSDDGQLEKDVVKKTYQSMGTTFEDYPSEVLVYYRSGFFIAVNYSSEPYTFNLNSQDEIIMGEKTLKPGEVLVWRSK